MELIFLPLLIVPFKYKQFGRSEWYFTLFFLAYAVTLTTLTLPLNSRLGSFYIGIPSFSYFFYMYPEIQTQYSSTVLRSLSFFGVVSAFVALVVFFY
ncbi:MULTISPECIES: hypothetical protein [unclassified Shewanella]|uniref:hypothetical protein n=1 Tax=unclassified Shewanella TaxID=196818 RepID=UPI001BC6BE45|nr:MULTISPECIES: hypothetical protein [unclassified Shewanella]GIU16850.1 hypothetical protein TUM4444_30040 [Shewanella sp. MBTL60-112-B1]GIU35961.1 hypothetical protein TUM4445_26450 [Shewanella sp. MBTL60-112-B2]